MFQILIFLCTLLIIYLLLKKKPKFNIDNKKKVAYGCTNKNSINYDPEADIDNGSCNFIEKKLKKKNKLYKQSIHVPLNYNYNNNISNFNKVVRYKLIDKYNNIKNSKFSILHSYENLTFDLYYNFNDTLVVLKLLNKILVPVNFSENLKLNSYKWELYSDKDKIKLNNNSLILIHNNKEIINVKVEYIVVGTLNLSSEIIPHNKNNSIENDEIIPHNYFGNDENNDFF